MLDNNQLNKSTANALCTIIALGFLSLNRTRVNTTQFLYEGENSADEHAVLANLMSNSPIAELSILFPPFEEQYGKADHPFIYARGSQIGDDISQVDIDEALSAFVAQLENICNIVIPGKQGAYIGGVANREQVKLLCPSILYQYDIPAYVNVDAQYTNDITTFYGRFLDVTEQLLDVFSNLMENQTGDEAIQFWSTADELRTLIETMPQNMCANRLLASIHGLITSMLMAPPNTLAGGNFNVELALSTGTNKVASCIPCSIFAMSQDAPASYTHLGRGDYWNLPQDCDAAIKQTWSDFVANCYSSGMEIAGDYMPDEWVEFFGGLNQELENNNPGYIAEVFLSALTFPSSFVSKMTYTIELLNAQAENIL